MINDSFLISFLSNMLRIVPTLLVCIGGIILMQTRMLPKKAKTYGIAGLGLLLIDALASVTFSTYLSSGNIEYSSSHFQVLQLGYSAASQVLYALALALLVMAICKKEQAAVPNKESEKPYAQ